jgi:hypothetical protein
VKIPLSFEDGSPDCRRGGETKEFAVVPRCADGRLFQVVTFLIDCVKESVSLDAEIPRGAERIGWIFKEVGILVSSFEEERKNGTCMV